MLNHYIYRGTLYLSPEGAGSESNCLPCFKRVQHMFDKNNKGTKGRVTQTLNSTPFLTIYLAEELTLSKGQGHSPRS